LPCRVFYTVGKVLRIRCWKWPRMSHSDICSTSYGQKKGRESNCQFDSRLLKVGNRPNPSVCRWSATHRRKALKESYKFALDLIPIRGLSWELWAPKVPRVQTGTVSGLFLGSLETKSRLDVGATERRREWGRWWLPPSPGRGEPSEFVLPVACPNTKSDFECDLTNLLVGFDAGPSN
jgi:hypothetical protein